jgi:hypothetical protein
MHVMPLVVIAERPAAGRCLRGDNQIFEDVVPALTDLQCPHDNGSNMSHPEMMPLVGDLAGRFAIGVDARSERGKAAPRLELNRAAPVGVAEPLSGGVVSRTGHRVVRGETSPRPGVSSWMERAPRVIEGGQLKCARTVDEKLYHRASRPSASN